MRLATSNESQLGGWVYPFLSRYESWTISVYEPKEYIAERPSGLAWSKDNGINVLSAIKDGVRQTAEQILTDNHLEVSMNKGGFVLSKRISRIMRPYLYYATLRSDVLDIQYNLDAKLADGAGIISRAALYEVVANLPVSTPHYAAKKAELMAATRVEITILTASGQDKGHCIVSDTLAGKTVILPQDTKSQIKLTNGATFIGINIVHGNDQMLLDFQSQVNLHPFFDNEYMLQSLSEDGQVFIDAVKNSDQQAALSKIDGLREQSVDDVYGSWWVRDYFMHQGSTHHFASVVRGLMNQHLTRLNHTNLDGLRLPILGGRYYVMPQYISDQIGMGISLDRGQCYIDGESLWVNNEDWLTYIASVTGGADMDDAYWVHPFTDYDEQRKVLAWRSPNQIGEYVVLTPTNDSVMPMWLGQSFRKADSRMLPTRIDAMDYDYLNMIDPSTAGGLGEGLTYGYEAMSLVAERIQANAGGLGGYCNRLMVSVAVWGRAPKMPPAPLEQIIDATVKTGENLSLVKKWCEEFAATILRNEIRVPAALTERAVGKKKADQVALTTGHWVDSLIAGVQAHIKHIEIVREELAAQACPPAALLEAGQQYVAMGAQLCSQYSKAFAEREEGSDIAPILELARVYSEAFLSSFPSDMQANVLLGALYYAYMRQGNAAPRDGVLFQQGDIAATTMKLLIAHDVLSAIVVENGRISVQTPSSKPQGIRVALNAAWFNAAKAMGLTNAALPSQMDKATKEVVSTRAKSLIATWASEGILKGRVYTVSLREDRKVLVTERGIVVGYIDQKQAPIFTDGQSVVVSMAEAKDGNLLLLVS